MKGANQRQRNERLNRALQNFLYGCLGAEGEAGAKPALAVLTELWRRQVWRDPRTVNVIGAPLGMSCLWQLNPKTFHVSACRQLHLLSVAFFWHVHA